MSNCKVKLTFVCLDFDSGKMENEIHPLTNNPSEAWEQISKKQKVFQIKVNIPTSDVASDKVLLFIFNSNEW